MIVYYVAQTLHSKMSLLENAHFEQKLQKLFIMVPWHKKDFPIQMFNAYYICQSQNNNDKMLGFMRNFTEHVKILLLRNYSYLIEMPTANLILHAHGFTP